MTKVKEMLPFLIATAISYFVLLSLLLLIGEVESGNIIIFFVIPLLCLLFSIAYGINNSLNILYAVSCHRLWICCIDRKCDRDDIA